MQWVLEFCVALVFGFHFNFEVSSLFLCIDVFLEAPLIDLCLQPIIDVFDGALRIIV